jgi:ABC-type polysaccharide/polyol phosphate transport system ATPase subunit
MSERPAERPPSIVAQDVWVNYLIRYHRQEVTLRETFVQLLNRLRPRTASEASGHSSQSFWPLRGIHLTAWPGEVIGIVGNNGAGKTTLLKTLAGICGPDRGRLTVRGRVGCLLSFGVGFKPNLSGRENVFINGCILGLSKREIERRMSEIVDFAELGDFIDAPVRTYSAGMKGRLGFSIAIHIDPDVLLLDEILSVGDAKFKAKAGSVLDRLRGDTKTVVVATHDMNLVRRSCTRALWLEQGRIRMDAAPDEVASAYLAASQPAVSGTPATPAPTAAVRAPVTAG